MSGDFWIALAVLVLLCLVGSSNRSGPYETHYSDQNDDLFDD